MGVRLAITLGDPAGVGPEIIETALGALLAEDPGFTPILVGPENLVAPMSRALGRRVEAVAQAPFVGLPRRASAASGESALAALMAGIALAQKGEVAAIVTAPISKEALALAGSKDLGHTTILERELGAGPISMAFFSERLRVALITAHLPMREMLDRLSGARVLEVTELMSAALERYLELPAPRLALAGLNPHAGEGGIMGREEIDILAPAVRDAVRAGHLLSGPYPSDTLFRRAFDGEFDGVVALYHDQALIPVKMLGLGQAVHVTLGLRVPRTSPDHGTAFDLVGTGKASAAGMLSAIRMAMRMAGR